MGGPLGFIGTESSSESDLENKLNAGDRSLLSVAVDDSELHRRRPRGVVALASLLMISFCSKFEKVALGIYSGVPDFRALELRLERGNGPPVMTVCPGSTASSFL